MLQAEVMLLTSQHATSGCYREGDTVKVITPDQAGLMFIAWRCLYAEIVGSRVSAVSYPPKVVRAPPFDGIVQEPLTQRQGGSGMRGKLDTSPCVLSVYYRLVRIGLVWSDTHPVSDPES